MRNCSACGRPLNIDSTLVVWVRAGIAVIPRHRSCDEAVDAGLRAA